MQNEPLNIPVDYPGTGMSTEEQARFLGENLGPAFRVAGIKNKILAFDHNWDLIALPIEVMTDSKAAAFAGGIAIYCKFRPRRVADCIEHIWSEEPRIGGVWQCGWLDCFDGAELCRRGDDI